jgi:tartrate/fumarate subfamily iron-sulfur-dependent hydro-lyase beta chain
MNTELIHPFTEDAVRGLSVGDMVRVSGRIFTGRDRLHRHLAEGGSCRADLRNSAIYHCGPVMLRDGAGWRVVAAGPTTSSRQDSYMPRIIERYGIRVIVGKGGMGEETRRACQAHGCVYLHAVGGAAGVLAQCIRSVGGVHFLKEFGSAEAMWELDVSGMEAVVTIDSHGQNFHDKIREQSRSALKGILEA